MDKELQTLSTIRDYTEEDKAFIMATFLRGLYYGDSWFSLIHKGIFMTAYKPVVEALLISPKNTVKILCLKEDPTVILGYSILSADFQTIHWCYVKSAWRGKGIAKSLTPAHPTTVTHLTELGRTLMSKYKSCIFNPFLT